MENESRNRKVKKCYQEWQVWIFGILVILSITFHTPMLIIISSLSAYWGNYQSTSLIQIMSSPWIYHGRNVEVKGYARFEFENQKLYLNQDDYEYDLPNAVWFSIGNSFQIQRKTLNSKYVVIRGKFDATYRGRSNSLIGGIRDIQMIEPLTIH